MRRGHSFICGRGLWRYDSVSAQAVFALKYRQQPEHADFFAENMSRAFGSWIRSLGIDCIVPVPISSDRFRQRGYNQAALLAKELEKELGIPVKEKIIRRVKATLPQKQVNGKERQNNLKNAFKIVQNDVKLNTVVVVDDIYTTGATMDAVAECLKGAGVGKVYCISLTVGRGM
jgi:ComF family protein